VELNWITAHELRDLQGVDFKPPETMAGLSFFRAEGGLRLVSGWKLDTRIVTYYPYDIAILGCRKIVCLDIFPVVSLSSGNSQCFPRQKMTGFLGRFISSELLG
jgi:hypothetical protein